jgi:hypothetical protein
MTEELKPRWYGLSRGNGNDGVSHNFPDYFVYTAHPFDLAEHDCIQQLRDEAWAAENVEVEGEADYTITATLYEGPDGETAFGAAWFIVEVFPADDEDIAKAMADRWGRPTFNGLTAALGSGKDIPSEPPYAGIAARYPYEENVNE